MISYAVFVRLRVMAFAVIMLFSILWTILLCVESFMHWDAPDSMQRNLLALLIVANALSAIFLPPLLAVRFKAWVDVVPLLMLFLAHAGAAVIYALCFSQLTCSSEGAGSRCGVVNILILVFSWLQPILLLSYLVGLAILTVRRRRNPQSPELFEKRLSELPMMRPPIGRDSMTSSKRFSEASKYSQSSAGDQSHIPWGGPTLNTISEAGEEPESELGSAGSSPRSSGKLSKQLPNSFF